VSLVSDISSESTHLQADRAGRRRLTTSRALALSLILVRYVSAS
jgi:hypothetical protein